MLLVLDEFLLQFSLLKSVQPDASSPVHGFNWLIAYSRPLLFCLLGGILLLMDAGYCEKYLQELVGWQWNPYRIRTVSIHTISSAIRDLLAIFLLLSPIAFTVGLIPQVN